MLGDTIHHILPLQIGCDRHLLILPFALERLTQERQYI